MKDEKEGDRAFTIPAEVPSNFSAVLPATVISLTHTKCLLSYDRPFVLSLTHLFNNDWHSPQADNSTDHYQKGFRLSSKTVLPVATGKRFEFLASRQFYRTGTKKVKVAHTRLPSVGFQS